MRGFTTSMTLLIILKVHWFWSSNQQERNYQCLSRLTFQVIIVMIPWHDGDTGYPDLFFLLNMMPMTVVW